MTPCHFPSRFIGIIAFLFLWLAYPIDVVAQPTTVAVLFPDLQEPYRSVVSSIIEGIQEEIKSPVKLFPLGEDSNASQLKGAIDQEHIAAIIALGRTGLAAAKQWRGEIPIVVGALLLAPDKKDKGISGISLAVDPEIFFSYLEQIAPSVKRVHVVYNSESSAWLVQSARASANKRHLQLIAYKSEDIKNSAIIYRDILNKSQPGQDAIWLIPDAVAIDDKIIFPLLLKGAWDQNVLVFSSNPTHVRRGALFALFPDNKAMGKSLAEMAETYLSDNGEKITDNIVLLKDVQAAINVRTAEHLGLLISNEQRQKFALIFPAP